MTRRRSLSTAILFAGLVWVILALPWMTVGPSFADPSWDLWDWQQQHKYLKDEVDARLVGIVMGLVSNLLLRSLAVWIGVIALMTISNLI